VSALITCHVYYTVNMITHGLVSCESKGLISLPINIYVKTRYFNTWIR
jgi:hypothetical protein